jgi:uncharacterized protein YbjT (DUF2867 family)
VGAYHVRTLSRKVGSPAAVALKALGVEVIQGELSDPVAVRAALSGAEAVFLVTQFWEHFDMEREFKEGAAFIDELAATPSVKKFVFSTLEDVTAVTGGAITSVHHFDGKGRLTAYVKAKGVPAVFVHMAAYLENWVGNLKPRPGADGTLVVTLPDMSGKPYNVVSVAETGKFVRPIFDNYESYVGKTIPLVSDLSPLEDQLAAIGAVLGRKVVYNPVPNAVFAGFGFPGAADLAGMFAFYRDGPIDRDPTTARALFPGASNTAAWAAANRAALSKAWGLE